jgi:hypothetical protein
MNPYAPSDSRYDLWPTHDITPSNRPQRYHEYRRAQLPRGRVFRDLNHLAFCRVRLAYWKGRDGAMSPSARLARDAFYDRLEDVRGLSGPALPGSTPLHFRQYMEAAQ